MLRLFGVLLLAGSLGAGAWFLWSNPQLWPESLRRAVAERLAATDPAPPAVTATRPLPRPAAEPAPQPVTPPPVDADLPPETGSPLAIATESAAETAIAAANARARAEAEARADAEARDRAEAEIRSAIAPYLTQESFDPAAIRAAMTGLEVSDDPRLVAARASVAAEIETVLAASGAAPAPEAAQRVPLDDSTAAPDNSAIIARIRELL